MLVTTAFGFLEKPALLQAALGVVSLTLVWFVVSSVLAWSKLRHVPGPFLASFSHVWTFRASWSGRLHQILEEEHEKYGEVLRVGPDAIAIYEPETWNRLNSARSAYTRGGWYSSARFDYRGDSVFTELDVVKHGKRKTKLVHGLAGKNVALLETKLNKWLAALVGSIRAKIARGEETIDFATLIRYFQVDLISEIATGQPWGNLADERDHFGFLETVSTATPAIQSFLLFPLARTIYTSTSFMQFFGPKITDNNGIGAFMRFVPL